MDNQYNLEVKLQDLIILKSAVEKIQILGKDAPAVADIYIKINNLYAKAEEDRLTSTPPQ